MMGFIAVGNFDVSINQVLREYMCNEDTKTGWNWSFKKFPQNMYSEVGIVI